MDDAAANSRPVTPRWWPAVTISLAIGLIGALAIAWATHRSLGASGDSIRYVEHARVLLGERSPIVNGEYAVSLSHYPPLYPLMLAAGMKLGFEPLTSARAINLICYALLATGSGSLVFALSRSTIRSVIAAMLIASSPAVFPIHCWAASEPPFLVGVLGVVACLIWWQQNPTHRRTALFASVVGVSTAIRYAGIAFIPATLLLTLQQRNSWRQRLTQTIIAGTIAAVPFVVVTIAHRLAGASAGNRQLAYVPISKEHWQDLGRTICEWFAPASMTPWIVVLLIVGWIVLLALGRRESRIRRIAIVLGATYLGFLLFSVSFMDAATPLDHRILAPLALILILWTCTDAGRTESRLCNILAAVFVLAAIAGGIISTASVIRESRDVGLGLAHRVFRESPLLEVARTLPPGAVIYATYPDAIQLYTQHDAEILPARSIKPDPRGIPIEQRVSLMRERLDRRGGYLVIFSSRRGRSSSIRPLRPDQWREVLPLEPVAHTSDGVILQYVPLRP